MNTPNNIAGYVWACVVIGGPILLGLAILWGKVRNGRRREGLKPKQNDTAERRNEGPLT